jgi:hypothetical protein
MSDNHLKDIAQEHMEEEEDDDVELLIAASILQKQSTTTYRIAGPSMSL